MLIKKPVPVASEAGTAAPNLASNAYEALSAMPVLGAVPPATLSTLADRAALHYIPAGSILFEPADAPAFAQFLLSGSIELLGIRDEVETLMDLVLPMDLLSPAAVLNRQPYLLRARVLEDSQLLLIEAESFRRAVSENHELCLALLAHQADQFRRRIMQVKNIRLRPAEERVGCYLLRLVESSRSGLPVRLPMEKRLIASKLGMARETFSRTLGLLPQHGLRVRGDLVVLENPAMARARFPLDPLIDGAAEITPGEGQGQ